MQPIGMITRDVVPGDEVVWTVGWAQGEFFSQAGEPSDTFVDAAGEVICFLELPTQRTIDACERLLREKWAS